jgi:hypothetical protein
LLNIANRAQANKMMIGYRLMSRSDTRKPAALRIPLNIKAFKDKKRDAPLGASL